MAHYPSFSNSLSSSRSSSQDKQPTYEEREHERMRREQRRREQKPPIVSQDRDRRVPTDNQGFPIISKYHDAGYRR